mgnify:CR=1 FL=1
MKTTGELRIPPRAIVDSYKSKTDKDLETLVRLKLIGSRILAKAFFRSLGIHPKTGRRAIKRMEALQWIGFDGKYIFTRSWQRIGYKSRKAGLYLATLPKKLSQLIFTFALKTVTRREVRARSSGSAMPKDLPSGYYCTALNISPRSYFRKIQSAVKARLIRVTKQRTKIGRKEEFLALHKNLRGVPLFKFGKFTVCPAPSKIDYLI